MISVNETIPYDMDFMYTCKPPTASEDVEDAELPPKRKHTKEEVELHPASDEKDQGKDCQTH